MISDSDRWNRIEEAFTGALDLDGADRGLYLRSVLRSDAALIEEVEAMLAAHERLEPLDIEKRLLGEPGKGDLSGTLIGHYRLVRLIARGGMGEVYAAEREGAPFRQQVALKLLRHDLADPEARQRFRQERQILARLVHPLVVPILDGGVTDGGRPYLVLRYVDGQPITVFCESNAHDPEHRLKLFCDVARAVDHAHANLVVHRDLKPSNVLVTADGEVQLLDFGVAKMLEPATGDDAPVTRVETRIMTLEYAAPEQIAGAAITTATDVYALGTLLYELLTGTRPFTRDANGQASLERRILQEAPEAPSAAARRTKGDRWAKRLRGDLDTILLKALAKEPEQRYSSVREFANDIGRFCSGQPVLARKPSVRYRISKFARRNRVASAVAAVSLLVLFSLMGMLWVQSRRAARERDIAREEQQKADRVVALLVDLFASADPGHRPGGRDLSIGEFLKTAESTVVRQELDAGIQARLRHALGKVYAARSQYGQAQTHFQAALDRLMPAKGNEDPATAAVLHDMAKLAAQTRPSGEAAVLLRRSLDLHRRIYGENHPSVAQCMHDLAVALDDRSEKLRLIERALALRRTLFPAGHVSVAESLTALGGYHYDGGDLRRAEREFGEAVEVARRAGPEGHPASLEAMNDLAVVRQKLGRFEEAERLLRVLLEQRRSIHGEETVPAGIAWGNLGTALAATGKYIECEETFRTAHTLLTRLLGPEHVLVANATRNLARVRLFRGDYREAYRLLREAADVHRKVNGPDSGYWYMRGQAAEIATALGRATDAANELRLVVSELSAAGIPPARISDMQIALGFALLDAGRAREAEPVMREALEARTRHIPPEHPSVAEAECGLGAALAAQGKAEGRNLIRRSLRKYRTWGLAVYASRAASRI